ncbi:MAG: hypothetical protein GY940_28115, partial [bacterium]|nr:hypothetical protein [bacterium]
MFTLWENGWLSRHTGYSIELDSQVVNYNAGAGGPRSQFIEITGDKTANKSTTNTRLSRLYVYLEGKNSQRQLWQYSPTGSSSMSWKIITKPEIIRGLQDNVRQRTIVNRNRLRLIPATPFIFERLGLDGVWRPLPWINGRVGIDYWTDLLYVKGDLWAATPLGLVRFSRMSGKAGDQVVLDPDNVLVIAEPVKNKRIPRVTDMKAAGSVVTIRCESDSNLVFRGTLDGLSDRNVFTPLQTKNKQPGSNDPFLIKTFVSNTANGFWEWGLEEGSDLQSGKLKGRRQGEDIQLIGGRFNFDGINSIAFFQNDRLEIGTDSGGWYRAPASQLHVSDLQRPKVQGASLNPELVREVRTGRGN